MNTPVNLNEAQRFAIDLIDFIHASPSKFHVVRNIKAALLKRNYQELRLEDKWVLEKEGKYFVSINESAIIAFIIGKGSPEEDGFKIIAAHTDSPALKIKPLPELITDKKYLGLNVEVYGGPILSTWFDRPLSIAGRVTLKSDNPLRPENKYFICRKPALIIPNLAIHFNREVNDGVKIHKQKDINPLVTVLKSDLEKDNFLINLLSQELKLNPEQILDFDLYTYEYEKGMLIGKNNEFISSGKLDDLSMVHAAFEGLFTSNIGNATQIIACFDNEEVGSQTKQGAGSPFLRNILERIIFKIGKNKEDYFRAISKSFMISADMAQALHPNFPEIHDKNTRPVINEGPVIKYNANQKYTSDSYSGAVFEMLCNAAGVPVQKYVNRSDLAGGSTLGSIATSQFEMKMVDVGNPMLAMHSIRELSGVYDHTYIKNVFRTFFDYNE